MRRVYLLLTLFVTHQVSFGQAVFAPEGAHWEYYRSGAMMDPYNPIINNSVTYVGDTLIENRPAKELEVQRLYSSHMGGFNSSSWSQFVAQTNDSVLYWVDDTWEFVFDLDVSEGDSRVVYIDYPFESHCPLHDTIVVDSVWTFEYAGLQLKAVDFHVLLDDWSGNPEYNYNRYVERVGFMSNYPTVPHWCQNQILHYAFAIFYCYHDDEILNSGGTVCSLSVGIEDTEAANKVEIFIYDDYLQIQSTPNSTLHVYDILGKQLLQERITSDNQSFDIGHLPNGILMVVIESEAGRLAKKVVKTYGN